MNHDLAIVEQDPFGFGSPFVSKGFAVRLLLQQLLDSVNKGLNMGAGVPGGYDEYFGDDEQISDFQQDNVLALLVGDGICGQTGERGCVYGFLPPYLGRH